LVIGAGVYYIEKDTSQKMIPDADTGLKIKYNLESFLAATDRHKPTVSGDVSSCSSILYGYENGYAYAWAFCGEYDKNFTVVTASSLPVRAQYDETYKIIEVKEAADGEHGEEVNRPLFGKFYETLMKTPLNQDLKVLEQEALKKIQTTSLTNKEITSTEQDTKGEYLGYIKSITSQNGTNSLVIDYVQWLTGKDAIKATLEDGECRIEGMSTDQAIAGLAKFDTSMGYGEVYGNCTPGGFYIRNQNTQLRTFPIANNVQIKLQTYNNQGNNYVVSPATFINIFNTATGEYPAKKLPYWITLNNGVVTGITEQYVP
jgi:hypothetical protein